MIGSITDVSGIEVGHYTDLEYATGCTVVLCREGAVGGVDVRGGSPGTRETDLLKPGNLVQQMHAALLTGGSAFGLAAATGVMQYLEEHGAGLKIGASTVPIVPAAVLFDLNLIAGNVRPGAEEGYIASANACSAPPAEGSVGAGTGATVAKVMGIQQAIKGGIGTASISLDKGIVVGAIVAVNSYGGVVDHTKGRLVAGPRQEMPPGMNDPVEHLLQGQHPHAASPSLTNTAIGVVATNAFLTKDQTNFLARMSHNGLALTIRPSHTIRDGDTIFAMATGSQASVEEGITDITQLGAAAVEVVAQSVLRGVRAAHGLGGVPSASEWTSG